ncbi:MAG: hypothetical protein JJU31_11240 [Wenzhouxiangella sp.]|nr:hypothetical protein [Wenzhouxiangella sp.]
MNNMQTFQPENDKVTNSRIRCSVAGGTECQLQAGNYRIVIWASNWTGREIVRVERDGIERVVSIKRSFGFKTPHAFELDGHRFLLEFRVGFGQVAVTLHRDGELIDAEQLDLNRIPVDPETGRIDWLRAGIQLGLPLLAGLAFGGSLGYVAAELLK